jgi:hypothetical protein
LEGIKDSQNAMTLTCDHRYHHKCFLSYALVSRGSIFISCPICREMNTKHPDFGSDSKNLIALLKEPRKRCCHRTKKGFVCKNRSVPFNYGYCKTHNKDTLSEKRYPLYYDYMKYLLESTNNWKTKVFMMDLAKKILIRDESVNKVTDIHHAFLEFFHRCKRDDNGFVECDPKDLYIYHELTYPPASWIDRCTYGKEIV